MSTTEADIFDACRSGDKAQVEKCYQRNPDSIHAADSRGYTPLILAVYNDQLEIADFLLQKGARVDGPDAAGNTALMGVCFKGYKEIAEKLIAAGADVNGRNENGATALTFAATFGHLQIAELLLQKGAAINIRDARGKSPLDHAIIQENEDMVALLQRYMVVEK